METKQSLIEKDAIEQLARLGGMLTAEEDVLFRGKQLIIPETMDLHKAVDFLRAKIREDEESMSFDRKFPFRPWDGARATYQAIKRAFGMVRQVGTPGFWGMEPPSLITINVGPDQTEQVPWGGLKVPMIENTTFYLGGYADKEMGTLFRITAEGPRKNRFLVEGLFKLVQEELETNSMFRGKAFDGQEEPKFLDLSSVRRDKVIYSEDVETQLEANVWALMRWTDKMEALGVPLKRAVLFEGPYGTGKTLGAYLTAQVAQEAGWTFIYCRPGRDSLEQVMATARLYQPACVFFEDIDTLASSNEEDHIAKLLDIFDGIQAKGTKIVCVLTTNHVEELHKGMLRPGRLDAIIHIGSLDATGYERMVRALVPEGQLADEIDWPAVAASMAGFLPAFAREAIDRAVRYNLARGHGTPSAITTSDLVGASEGLRPQLQLMEDAADKPQVNALGEAFSAVVEKAASSAVNGVPLVDQNRDRTLGVLVTGSSSI